MTQKTGQKCTAIRRSLVPATPAGAVVDASANGWPRSGRRPARRRHPHGRAGQPRPARGGAQGHPVAAAAGRGRPRRPRQAPAGRGDPDRGAFLAPTVLRAPPRGARAARRRGVRAGHRRARLRRPGQAVELAALGRGSLVGSVVTHDPGFARPVVVASRLGTAASWSSTATTPASRPATAPRCPSWSTAGPAGPGAARSSAGSARSCTSCSSPRSASPAMAPPSPAGGRRARPTTGDATHPFRAPSRSCASARRACARPDGDPRGHRTVRRPLRRPLLRPHGPRPRPANPFFDGRVAHGYFVVSAAAGLFVDPDPGPCWPTTAWTGSASSSRSTPATPWRCR